MKKLLIKLIPWLSTCLNCGSFQADHGRLCVKCRDVLVLYSRTASMKNINNRLRALYWWEPGRSDLLSRLILGLKGSYGRWAWFYYGKLLVRENMASLPQGKQICVVPAPSSTGKPDHAGYLAMSVAQLLGAEYLPCLRKVCRGKQRVADRGERALIALELIEKNTVLLRNPAETVWIFVDDILTTGATARAASVALGSPPHFEIWVLAERRLSCGASKDLI